MSWPGVPDADDPARIATTMPPWTGQRQSSVRSAL